MITKDYLIKRGNKIINVDNFSISWEAYLNSTIGFFEEMDLALTALEMLYQNTSYSELYDFFIPHIKNEFGMAILLDILTLYSDRGIDFEEYALHRFETEEDAYSDNYAEA